MHALTHTYKDVSACTCYEGDQWMKFDIGPPTLVTGLVTKGRGEDNKKHWVTRFRISFSNDSRTWHFYRENSVKIKVSHRHNEGMHKRTTTYRHNAYRPTYELMRQ